MWGKVTKRSITSYKIVGLAQWQVETLNNNVVYGLLAWIAAQWQLQPVCLASVHGFKSNKESSRAHRWDQPGCLASVYGFKNHKECSMQKQQPVCLANDRGSMA
jgi:hypothetical protein